VLEVQLRGGDRRLGEPDLRPGYRDRAASRVVVLLGDRLGPDQLLDAGELDGGIVPKLRAAVTAARLGVRAEIGETAVVA